MAAAEVIVAVVASDGDGRWHSCDAVGGSRGDGDWGGGVGAGVTFWSYKGRMTRPLGSLKGYFCDRLLAEAWPLYYSSLCELSWGSSVVGRSLPRVCIPFFACVALGVSGCTVDGVVLPW